MADEKKDDRKAADEARATAQVEADKKAALDEVERARIDAAEKARGRQALAAKNKQLDEIARAEADAGKAPEGQYGPFADHPQKFVVVGEMVGKHRQGEEITYRDLMAYHDKERTRPHVGATRANADRLVAAGHLRPLVHLGD